ncbi:MAG TPA: helix-turn-helix transcriptional regulator [Caulobacteraceae bacterium]|nr:helix-turn-helix transcriptional regulator [Caulobacteraceae bacterium]
MDLSTELDARPFTRDDVLQVSPPPMSRKDVVRPIAPNQVAPNHLQTLREARGLTLRELAQRVGASRQHMSSLERGGRRLTADWLLRLSEGLDCHPCEILAIDAPEGLSRRERVILAYVRQLSRDQQASLLDFLAAAAPGRRRRRDDAHGVDDLSID